MKVLVIRFSSIGDIVLTTPVVRGLARQAGAVVHFAVKQQYAGLLASNPYVKKVHVLGSDLGKFRDELRQEKFDFVIDLHNNLRTRILLSTLGVKVFRFNKLNIEKWLMVNFKLNFLPNQHIVDRYLATVLSLGVLNDNEGLDYFIPEAERVPLSSFPSAHQNGFVAYAIGGQHETKKLPVGRMIELCIKINRPIVLLGGKEDFANAERVRLFCLQDEKHHRGTIVFNGCGIYTLSQSASILKLADKVFSHDTGLMHIAAALKKDVVAIWGNTIPSFGMYPYQTSFVNLENKELACRPCSKIGYDRCPKKHFKCMNELKFDF